MKKILIFISVIVLTHGSCKEIEQLTHFYMDFTSNITVESTFIIDVPFDVWTPNISTFSDEVFKKNNTNSNMVEEIVLKEMKMNITSPESQSFDFLKSIEIYISAEGFEEEKIAWHNDIPQTGLSSINLETSDDDLKEYIKKDGYKLRTRVVTRQVISESTDIEIISTFFVDAQILGI